jgi:hypothetical protein
LEPHLILQFGNRYDLNEIAKSAVSRQSEVERLGCNQLITQYFRKQINANFSFEKVAQLH